MSTRALYHGTHAELDAGARLLPANTLGLPELAPTINQPRYSPRWVYVTERLDYAQAFGHVYRVQPLGPLEPDPDAARAWRCRRALVLERVAEARTW